MIIPRNVFFATVICISVVLVVALMSFSLIRRYRKLESNVLNINNKDNASDKIQKQQDSNLP